MTIFETKEQYLTFRAAWAKAAQAKKLTAAHMVLFNLARGKPIHHGFTPVTNKNKLLNGTRINHGLYAACVTLRSQLEKAKRIVNKDTQSLTYGKIDITDSLLFWVNQLVGPFEGTFTVEMAAKLDIPKVESLDPDFGKGREIAHAIIAGELQPTNMNDLEEWNNE